jgi:uncharacterized protein (TIGR02099 family)
MNTATGNEWRSGVRTVRLWLLGSLAVLIIVISLLVSVFRFIVPQVPEYRQEIVAWTSEVLGAPVVVDEMDLQWRGFRPELVLHDVGFVSANARTAVAAREVRLAISLRTLFAQGRFTPARILMVEPDVTLVLDEQNPATGVDDWRRAFSAGEHRGDFVISRGNVTLAFDSGRRRIELVGLDMSVSSDGTQHQVRATTRLGEGVSGLVAVRGTATGWPGEDDFTADLHAETRGMDLVGLQHLSRVGTMEAGRMDAVVSLEVEDGEAHRFSVDLDLTALAWPMTGAAMTVDRAAAGFVWIRTDSGWEATLQQLEVDRGAGPRTSGPFSVTFVAPLPGNPTAQWRVESGRIEMDDVATMLDAIPIEYGAGMDELLARNPGGTLIHGMMDLQRAPGRPVRYDFGVEAAGLRLDAAQHGPVPGFTSATAVVTGSQSGGDFDFRLNNGELDFNGMFRTPIPMTELALQGSWVIGDDGWVISTDQLRTVNADLDADSSVRIAGSDDGHGTIHAETAIHTARLVSKSTYVPASILSERLTEWLDRSIVDGVLTAGNGRLVMHFGGSGELPPPELDVHITAQDTTLAYARNWPALEDAAVDARFNWNGLEARIHDGMLAGADVHGADVQMASYRSRSLEVTGQVGDSLAVLFDGFRATPAGRAEWLQHAEVDGDGTLGLELSINLVARRTEMTGNIELRDATFAVGGFEHPLTNLAGIVSITRDGFASTGVDGRLLGGAVEVTARTLRDTDGTARAIEVALAGRMDRAMLAQLAGHDELPVSGSTDWEARLLAPYGGAQAPILQMESDLAGLAVELPEPLGKAADSSHPLTLQMELGPERRRVVLESGERVRADATVERREDGEWMLARGRAHLGPGTPGPVPERDFAVTGWLAEWQITLGRLTPMVAATQFPLTRVDLDIDDFTAWGHSLGLVSIEGTRSDLGWHWLLDGSRASGTIDLPDEPTDESPVRADFAHLDMPVVTRRGEQPPIHADPRSLPPIAFYAADFGMGIVHLGEVSGFLRPVPDGIELDSFTATRDEMRMTAEASWYMVDGEHRTTLRGILDSTDVQPTLAALGYAASVDAAAGHIEADVAWRDSPLVNPLPTTSGSFRVRMERGTLLDLDPGAGRVFGMLSLNALPRRLALDFSDVYQRGLAFDSITGSFEVIDGDAYTEDLVLQGPAARVEITGRTGLATRDYNQTATVVGSLASSLTLAGTLLGGPAVGAALLVVSELLRRPLEDMVRVRYQITGPWDEPVVERLPAEAR